MLPVGITCLEATQSSRILFCVKSSIYKIIQNNDPRLSKFIIFVIIDTFCTNQAESEKLKIKKYKFSKKVFIRKIHFKKEWWTEE